MKPAINSIPEAAAEMQRMVESALRLQAFFERFEGILDQVTGLRGVAQESKSSKTTILPDPVGAQQMPKTFALRVQAIITEMGPLMPKEIVSENERRGWPQPNRGSLYNLIGGILSHMKKDELVSRTDTGYVWTATKPLHRKSVEEKVA